MSTMFKICEAIALLDMVSRVKCEVVVTSLTLLRLLHSHTL